jgi:hypothetical protein
MHLIVLVRAGATFHKGKLLDDPSTSHPTHQNDQPEVAGSEAA